MELLVSDLMQAWLMDLKGSLRPTSHYIYERQVQRYILPQVGMLPISELTEETNAQLKQSLFDRGMSPHLVRDVTSRFSQAMRWGADQGYDLPVIRNKQEQSEQGIRTLTAEESERLAASLMGERDSFINAVLLTWKAGLTIGEACALEWSDIDIQTGMIRVHRLCQRVPGGLEYTEEEPRIVPVPKGMKMDGKSHDFVIQSARNDGTEPRLCQLWLKDHVKKMGLPEHLTYATLRNTYIRNLMESGTDFIQVSRLAGNKDLNDLWRKFGVYYSL